MPPTESAGLMYVVSLEAPQSGWPQLLTTSQFATRTHAHFHLQLSGLSAVGTTAESLPLGNMICLPLINTPVCALRQCNLHDCSHHYSCFSAVVELLGAWLLLHVLQQFEALKALKKILPLKSKDIYTVQLLRWRKKETTQWLSKTNSVLTLCLQPPVKSLDFTQPDVASVTWKGHLWSFNTLCDITEGSPPELWFL